MSMLLREMDNMPAWDYMQQLLQDSPDILGNLELHTSVLLRSEHTSASMKFKSTNNCIDI
jgi:hypothetical protein